MSVELAAIAKKPMSPSESKLLGELTRSDTTIEVTIPADIKPSEWKSTASVVGRAYLRAEMQLTKLLPVLGRLLVIAEANPEIWEGHESFKQFIHTEVRDKFGISPASSYYAMQMARRLSHVEIAQLEAVPRRNMLVYLQAVPKGDEKKTVAKNLLEKAATLSEADFREFCEKKKYIESGDTQGAFVRIPCSKKVLKLWNKFVADPQVQSVCGTGHPGGILEHMIEECSSWKATADDAIAAQAETAGSSEAA